MPDRMTDVKPDRSPAQIASAHPPQEGADPLAHLHKMSTTAGLGSTDYVAVNGLAVATVFVGLASALSLMDNSFLVIPVVAIVLAVTALRQIGQSNGTQTGKGLAWLGLVLAVLFAASVGGRDVYEAYSNRQDEQAITQIITQLDQDVRNQDFSKAYGLFSGKFASRVQEQPFTFIWRRTVQGVNHGPKLASITYNGHMEFDISPDNGMKEAVGMTIFTFDREIPDQRIPVVFEKTPSGTWLIDDIPVLFPKQQQPPTRPK